MMVRLKSFQAGDTVRLHNVVSYPLATGLEEGQLGLVLDCRSGSVLIRTRWEGHAEEIDRWIPLPNIDPGSEYLVDGRWLDQRDRRVQKIRARRRAGVTPSSLRSVPS